MLLFIEKWLNARTFVYDPVPKGGKIGACWTVGYIHFTWTVPAGPRPFSCHELVAQQRVVENHVCYGLWWRLNVNTNLLGTLKSYNHFLPRHSDYSFVLTPWTNMYNICKTYLIRNMSAWKCIFGFQNPLPETRLNTKTDEVWQRAENGKRLRNRNYQSLYAMQPHADNGRWASRDHDSILDRKFRKLRFICREYLSIYVPCSPQCI